MKTELVLVVAGPGSGRPVPLLVAYARHVASRTPLGDFLRARRALVRPEDVGLTPGPRRRVAGLRREEVALLAGISAEYYLRLEQGREKHPSDAVVEALAAPLRLDDEGAAHALRLARSRPARRPRATAPRETVPAGVRMLLDTLNVPAFVMNRYRDVLAANALATRLEPALADGRNRLLSLFTDPAARDYHPDWDQSTAGVVAQLRADVGADQDDPRFRSLVEELSRTSDRFRALWARHDVSVAGAATGTIRHPELGDLVLRREKLALVGSARLVLVVYHAEPGSVSAERLSRLGSCTPVAFPAIAGPDRDQVLGYADGMTDEEHEREVVYELTRQSAKVDTWTEADAVEVDDR